ncbi:hypothetical protein IM660_15135 [Ruania alkalisoli]|uniref:HTH luxR-type domain-containing protein n=1 Tax=Ruania alkalisoli TaxID=2779775 RepID=A0A7M1SR85_9MICO|nr:hypothetical protein [Ruania alkalisoli]QOR69961.1 hypothetical protein IM660_15135 [Ruania alkalisoli]
MVDVSPGLPRLSTSYVPPSELAATTTALPAVTVVRAPRGWGKASWVRWMVTRSTEEVLPVWVRLTPGLDERGFWHRMRHAAGVSAAIEDSRADSAAFAAVLGAQAARRARHVVLVLDGYHHVTDPRIDRGVVGLVRRGGLIRTVVLTRREQPIEHLLLAEPGATLVRAPDLALGADEVAQNAELSGRPIDREEAAALCADVGGWPALVRLLLRDRQSRAPRGGLERFLAATLREPDAAEFAQPLMVLSASEHLDGPTLADLCGEDATPESVRRVLAESGLLVGGQIPERIRQAAAALLAETDPPLARRVRQRLADRWRGAGDAVRALEQAVAAEDHRLIEELATSSWMSLLDHPDVASRALAQLPDRLVAQRAELLLLRSGGELRARRPVTDEFGQSPALARVPELLERLALRRLLAVDLARAQHTFAELYRSVEVPGKPRQRRTAAAGHALASALLGQRRRGLAWYELAESVTEARALHDIGACLAGLARWVLHFDGAEPGSPASIETSGCPVPELVELAEVIEAAFAVRDPASHDLMRVEFASDRVDADETSPLIVSVALSLQVDVFLLAGELDRCRSLLARTSGGLRVAETLAARVDLYTGDNVGALRRTGGFDQWAAAHPRRAVGLALVRACAQHRLGLHTEAKDTLRFAVTVAQMHWLVSAFLMVPRQDLLAIAGEQQDLRAFLDRIPFDRTGPGYPPPGAPVHLTDREFAVLRDLQGPWSLTVLAHRSYVTVNTVRTQVRAIYSKLGVHTRADAVRRGRELGLLPPES